MQHRDAPPDPTASVAATRERWAVCVVAYYALPVVDPAEAGAFGGTETRAWSIAQLLAERSEFEVRLIVRHSRPARCIQRSGVRIVTRVDRWRELRRFVSDHVDVLPTWPRLRVRRWHWSLLWKAPWLAATRPFRPRDPDPTRPDPFFQNQQADVFLCFGANEVSASVVSTCRAVGSRSILLLGADSDVDERFVEGAGYTNANGQRGDVCLHALTHVDAIVAQTERQRKMLRQRFGREAAVIGNPIDVSVWRPAQPPLFENASRYALWVGRADRFHKRPLLLLEMAEHCPQTPFLMVMNPADQTVADEVRRRCPPNVRIVDRIPFEQMPQVVQNAFVLVSTGSAEYEGFPNVFLQAAACGVPIASWEADPGFIATQECGLVAGDAVALAQYIQRIERDPDLREEIGRRGREYVCRHHDRRSIGDQIARVVHRAAASGGSQPPDGLRL
jgi:glycosyltransferase involved in cell wall biosynthesis